MSKVAAEALSWAVVTGRGVRGCGAGVVGSSVSFIVFTTVYSIERLRNSLTIGWVQPRFFE
ncbi:hypothetical protein [Amycolatopsis sp. NPDC004079]|uniref:hypothetical protein n=1 Tax=Amycolatopsis sp. NPDC004079 TaxID=3154549 RepID=UPI0033A93BC4